MNIREIIKKAKQSAKTPDEVLLPERFEEYLDLLEMTQQVTPNEMAELRPKLKQSLFSLKEVAERVASSYGMDPAAMIELFINPQNIGVDLKLSIQNFERNMQASLEEPKKPQKFSKRKNRNVKV